MLTSFGPNAYFFFGKARLFSLPIKAIEEKKPGFFKRLGRFFRELKAELKKVAWPTRADTMKKTGVVILCVIVVGVIVWIFDGIASGVVNALLALFGG